MYAKKNKKPMYGKGGMAKLARYMKGGRIYAENGDRLPEASADPLKSPAVQASIEKLLSPYRDQIDYMRQQRSKYGSNDPAVGGLRSQTRSAYAALEGAGEGDVDVLRSLISMEPTNREEAEQKAKAIEFAQAVSDEYAREMGTPVRNPLYNFFGLEGGPKYKNGGTVKYRSGGMMKYEQGGEVSREPKVDIIDNKILVGGSMIKKQKPGGGFEYVPKPEYANEAMFYVDGVPATFADAKFAYEQTSDAGVGLDFNDYIEKYTKQRGAYDMDLKKQRESLGERAEAAGTPALLRALRDMR